MLANPAGSARHDSGSIAKATPSTTRTSTAATFTKMSRSSATYTTGANVSEKPMTSRLTTAMIVGLPPNR